MEIKNAQIKETFLGYEDHGILTCFLYLDYGDGGMQGFGGYSLGKDYTSKWIEGILKTVGVDKWEELEGKMIRVKFDNNEFNPIIRSIGHIIEDKWFDPKAI